MILILFRSKLVEGARAGGYDAAGARMLELARRAPGFAGMKDYLAEDGERLSVVRWEDRESLRAWREDPRHSEVQQAGRDRWYEYYDMEVAEVDRTSRFVRREKPSSTAGG